jgi:hypothetical protein
MTMVIMMHRKMKIMTMTSQNMKTILMKIMTMTTKITMTIMMMTRTTMMKIMTTTITMIMTMMKMTTMMTAEDVAAVAEEVPEAETSSVTAREDLLPEEADHEVVPAQDQTQVLAPDQAAGAGHHQVQETEHPEEVLHQ